MDYKFTALSAVCGFNIYFILHQIQFNIKTRKSIQMLNCKIQEYKKFQEKYNVSK